MTTCHPALMNQPYRTGHLCASLVLEVRDMRSPSPLGPHTIAGCVPILVRAAAGLLVLGITGLGRPALIDRRTGTVRRV